MAQLSSPTRGLLSLSPAARLAVRPAAGDTALTHTQWPVRQRTDHQRQQWANMLADLKHLDSLSPADYASWGDAQQIWGWDIEEIPLRPLNRRQLFISLATRLRRIGLYPPDHWSDPAAFPFLYDLTASCSGNTVTADWYPRLGDTHSVELWLIPRRDAYYPTWRSRRVWHSTHLSSAAPVQLEIHSPTRYTVRAIQFLNYDGTAINAMYSPITHT